MELPSTNNTELAPENVNSIKTLKQAKKPCNHSMATRFFCIATSQAAAELARADIWRPHTIPEFIIKNSGDCPGGTLVYFSFCAAFFIPKYMRLPIATPVVFKSKSSTSLQRS